MRIWFFWTPHLAARVLEDLIASPSMEVAFIVTNPDKPFGRDQILRPSLVKKSALENHIPVYTPTKIRDNKEFFDILRSYVCDYFIVVAYGRILPLELLEIPKKLSINIHGSILPKYRGASPIQAALLAWETETWVTIMKMSIGMDEGDILKIRNIPIDQTETSETLFEKFSKISWQTLIQTLHELEMGGITPLPQDNTLATYCKKIEKEDGLVDWSKSAEEIYHMWQAYTPWPGIYTMYEGKRLLPEKVFLYRHSDEGRIQIPVIPAQKVNSLEVGREAPLGDAGILEKSKQDSVTSTEWQKQGQVIKLKNGNIGIICGEWILTLDQVKLEWKRSQSIRDFVNGNQGFIFHYLR